MKKLWMSIFIMILCITTGCGKEEKSQVISAIEAKTMMDEKEVVVIDVRTFYEYEQGHIKGAINVPLSELEENNPNLPSKEEVILVYCQSGNRSKQAASKLEKLGYHHIYDFGGINDWTYGVETGK